MQHFVIIANIYTITVANSIVSIVNIMQHISYTYVPNWRNSILFELTRIYVKGILKGVIKQCLD